MHNPTNLMQELTAAAQQQVSGGCSPKCLPVDRRPLSPIPTSYNPTNLGTRDPGDWRAPPQARWPSFAER